MANTRICFVGGGSYNWMPKLLGDLALTPDLGGTVVLHDINPNAIQDIEQYGRKAFASTGSNWTIETTTDLGTALDGAEFVVVTITTGGLETMGLDLEIPEKYGIFQSVGDTVGPGGLSRALRNVPVMANIAQAMERRCPDAWMLNLTNPMTVLTRVVSMTSRIKVIGLCHELFGVRGGLMRMFGANVEDFQYRVVGVNHLIWILDMTIRGQDGFRMLRDFMASGRQLPTPPSRGDWHEPFRDNWKLKLALFDLYDALPAAGDRHLAEFFPYFLTPATDYGAEYGVGLTKISHRKQQVASAREAVREAIEGDFPAVSRSHEATADIVSAVANGRSVRTIVNLPNIGQVDELPRGAVVETLAEITSAGAAPHTVGKVPLGVLSTLQPHVVNQELIVQASLTGDYKLALQAMANDPLVHDLKTARALLDDLLAAHAELLPQFAKQRSVARAA
jgi:alpha-galactosidase/6-phospho-beta-glucosidase family protein